MFRGAAAAEKQINHHSRSRRQSKAFIRPPLLPTPSVSTSLLRRHRPSVAARIQIKTVLVCRVVKGTAPSYLNPPPHHHQHKHWPCCSVVSPAGRQGEPSKTPVCGSFCEVISPTGSVWRNVGIFTTKPHDMLHQLMLLFKIDSLLMTWPHSKLVAIYNEQILRNGGFVGAPSAHFLCETLSARTDWSLISLKKHTSREKSANLS